MISQTAKHALAALTFLAELPAGHYAGAAEIAAEINAPRNYLGKLLKTLADEGLVESQKGRGGGVRLARSPESVSLLEAVARIDRMNRWSDCFLGRGRCSANGPCAVHERWAEVRRTYLSFLRETTIGDLATRAKRETSQSS